MTNKPIYLFVTPFFPTPESWRGGYCYDAARALVRTGKFDVRVMTAGPGDDYEYGGMKVFRFKRLSAPCGLTPFLFSWRNKAYFKKKIAEMGVDWREVAVCHVHTMEYAIYGEECKRISPSTLTLLQHHCCAPVTLRTGRLGIIPGHATILYWFCRRLCWNVDAHVFISKMSQDTFGKFFPRVPEEPWIDIRRSLWLGRFLPPIRYKHALLLYNGVDGSVFNEEGRGSHAGFVIGCVANFQPLKDHMTLLKAFARVVKKVPDATLRLIGSGECLAECQKYAAENCPAGSVRFETEVDHTKLPSFYRSIDLFVLPSRLEGFCCVCMEALYCGTPFISCDTTAVGENLSGEDRKKWLIAPMDDASLAEKIIHYYQNPTVLRLNRDLSIDSLIQDFVKQLEGVPR